MKTQFFKVVKINDQKEEYTQLSCLRIILDIDIWSFICHKYLDTLEYAQKAHEDPYGSIYYLDLKEYLKNDFPEVYSTIKSSISLSNENIENSDIKVYLATSHDYRQVDKNFDNEMTFLEYINSEISEGDKCRKITVEILKDNGFEEITMPDMILYYKNEYNINDYHEYRLWTNKKDKEENCLKLDIDNGPNNRGTNWHLHIDNNVCCTIGSADINNVWEFNTLMQVFGSKFKLK